jgi:oligopeptide transport system ATP-binding protein
LNSDSVILNVKDLHTEFHTKDGIVHAVNGVSLQLHEGETLGIVGESGCGKSVTFLSVMRLLPVPPARIASGSVQFLNHDILKIDEREMQNIRGRKMAMIFQDPMTSLNPVLSIGYQLAEPIRLHYSASHKEASERAVEMLKLVGIPEARSRLNDFPHQFSGGMRQRVMIAMALACDPPLLIADEPTTALDVTIQAQIVDIVKRLREQLNMSLIWITHDLGIVAGLANRVIVMYSGYIVEEAPVKELFAHPSHPYTRALLRSLPNIKGSTGTKLETIEGLPPDLVNLPKGCPFAPRCSFVVDKCREMNPVLEQISPGHKAACWVKI